MQSSSAFLYAEWAGRLGFLLLEYDCRMVPIIYRIPIILSQGYERPYSTVDFGEVQQDEYFLYLVRFCSSKSCK